MANDAGRTPQRRRMPAAERKTQIVNAARDMFVRYGYSGTRTRHIAEAAGVTEAVLYQHFPSKEALFDEAIVTVLTKTRTDILMHTRVVAEAALRGDPDETAEAEGELYTNCRHLPARTRGRALLGPRVRKNVLLRVLPPTYAEDGPVALRLIRSGRGRQCGGDQSVCHICHLRHEPRLRPPRAFSGRKRSPRNELCTRSPQFCPAGSAADMATGNLKRTTPPEPSTTPESSANGASGSAGIDSVTPSEVTVQRRHLLCEAARTVFTEKGWARARTRDIAQEAGVTETVLYRYFSSKEALFEAAILEPLEGLVADLTELEPSYETVTLRDRAPISDKVNAVMHLRLVEIAPLLCIALVLRFRKGQGVLSGPRRPLVAGCQRILLDHASAEGARGGASRGPDHHSPRHAFRRGYPADAQ